MSFSKNVKSELATIKDISPYFRQILLYGCFFGIRLNSNGIFIFKSDNEDVRNLAKRLLASFNYSCNGNTVKVEYNNALREYAPDLDGNKHIFGNDNETGIFLRGVFLTCGVVSDPNKEYHLEIVPSSEAKVDFLYTLINERGLAVKKSNRKEQSFLYIKESELISDFLTYIGASVHSMELMNVKILKDVRNNVNRTVNCEAANIGKTAKAAGNQLLDIEHIISVKGLEYFPPELRQVAEIRLNNIEMSLKDIGENCEPRLSRSGVNHRMKRINEMANELRDNIE